MTSLGTYSPNQTWIPRCNNNDDKGGCLRTAKTIAFVLATTIIILAGHTSQASDTTPGGAEQSSLEEIIVTAEKRSTDIQRTPISMTAITGKALDEDQIRTLTDVSALAPAFKMGDAGGYQQITIRGIGINNFTPGFDSTVAVNVNGIYVSRPIAQATSLFDVSQLEVLRGPQGTLYGRNASAGSVNISTTQPTNDLSGDAKFIVGNYHDLYVEAAVGGAIMPDKLLIRIAGFSENRGGYGTNIVTGNDVDNRTAQGVRGTVVFMPFENFKATLIAERYTEKDNGGSLHYFGAAGLSGVPGALESPPLFQVFGGYSASRAWDVATVRDPKFQLDTSAFTGTLNWDLAPFTLRSISGYRGQSSNTFTPLDGGSVANIELYTGEPAYQFSEELQARYDSAQLHGTVGVYYFSEEDNYSPSTVIASGQLLNLFFPLATPRPATEFYNLGQLGGLLRTEAEAAFAQGTYDVGGGFSLTGGIRYSYEHKRLFQRYAFTINEPFLASTPAVPAIEQPAETFTATTPKFGLQYQLDPKTMVYATYAKGFKAGGYDTGTNPAARFQPETLSSYEVGLKSTWLDNRLRTDIDGFFYDYKNLQVTQIVGLEPTTDNAATARIYGIEAEFSAAPIDSIAVNGWLAWTHARYVNYFGSDPALPLLPGNANFGGKALDNAPDYAAHLSVEYTWHIPSGTLGLRAESDYSSRFYFAPDNLPLLSQGAYVKGNAFLTYTNLRRWYATAFVRNVSDVAVKSSALVNAALAGNPVQGSYAPPRTFGLEVGYRF